MRRIILAVFVLLLVAAPSFAFFREGWKAGPVAPPVPSGVTTIISPSTTGGSPWTGAALSGSTPTAIPALDATIHNQKTVAGTCNTTNDLTCGGTTGGHIILTLNSTTALASGDQFTVGSAGGTISGAVNVGGTVEANGTWTIVNLDSTHILLCTQVKTDYSGCLNGPAFANAWTSGGTVGADIAPVAAFDEIQAPLVEADNTEYIGVTGAIPNRGWLRDMDCYFEGNTVNVHIDKRASNPTFGTHGMILGINGDKVHDGLAELVCDLHPVNGRDARIANRIWFNEPGLTGVLTRPVVYADYGGESTDDNGTCAQRGGGAGGPVRGTLANPYRSFYYALACGTGGALTEGMIVCAQNVFREPSNTSNPGGGVNHNTKRIDVYPYGDSHCPGTSANTYTLGMATISFYYMYAQNTVFHNAIVDGAGILYVNERGANPGLDAYGAFLATVTVQNSTFIDSAGLLGPTYGGYASGPATYSAQWGHWTASTQVFFAITESTFNPLTSGGGTSFRRNNTGYVTGDFLDMVTPIYQGDTPTYIGVGQYIANEQLSIYTDSSGSFNSELQRWSREPAGITSGATVELGQENCTIATAVAPCNQGAASSLPLATIVTYSAPNTTITVATTNTTVAPTTPMCVEFPNSTYQSSIAVNPSCTNRHAVGATSVVQSNGTVASFKVAGDVTCTGSPSSCVAVGDPVFGYGLFHEDAYQIFVNGVGSPINNSGYNDYNAYVENYQAISNAQFQLYQVGAWHPGDTISGAGTTITRSCSPACGDTVLAGSFARIIAVANPTDYQYRKIVVGGKNSFTIDHPFSQDPAGADWNSISNALRTSCVACRIGGTTEGSQTDNPSGGFAGAGKSQMQQGQENYNWIESTHNHTGMLLLTKGNGVGGGNAGSGFSSQYSAWYDSNMGFGFSASQSSSMPINNFDSDTTFQAYTEGVVLDNNNFTGAPDWRQAAYGTGNTNQVANCDAGFAHPNGGASWHIGIDSIVDTTMKVGNYQTGSGAACVAAPPLWLTKAMRGTVGNPYLADGSSMYPWAPDGTAHSALVGAW